MTISSIGIIGHGQFGAFLERLFRQYAPGLSVRIYSSRKEPDHVRFFPYEAVCKSDVLVLAVPIHALEDSLEGVLPHIGGKTVVVDVATVKAHPLSLLQRAQEQHPHLRYAALHPMFGPFSFTKNNEEVRGLRVALVAHTLEKEEERQVLAWLEALGITVVRMEAHEHDKLLAETLFITHLIGQTMRQAGFVRTDIDTLSFGYLMHAVESVVGDTALFRDVIAYNPYCKQAAKRLHRALAEVQEAFPLRQDTSFQKGFVDRR